jgi:tetratricopeptide (TPR) repeat protein
MRVDPRRDHSFRVPRPDLSVKLNTPNACNGCHTDRSAQWAADKTTEWFPDGRSGRAHYGEVFNAARRGIGGQTADGLAQIALDLSQAAIVRATALDLLRPLVNASLFGRVVPLLNDKSDLVRQAALRLLDRAPAQARASLAGGLLTDPVGAVRLDAARSLASVPSQSLPPILQRKVQSAMSEYQRSLLANADFPETQMQIAGLAMVTRNFRAAQAALRSALSMDPQLVQAWFTLARIQSALGEAEEATKTLEQAVIRLPNNGDVFAQLGAQYTSLGQHRKAIEALEKSLSLSGTAPDRLELLAQNHLALNSFARARDYANQLMSAYPDHQPSPLVRQLLQTQQQN